MESLTQNAETLFSNLEKFLKTETVVGEPMVIGDTTVIPLINVSFGCGTGGGSGQDEKGNGGTGGGLGAGAKISPNSILVIHDGEVKLLGMKGKSSLSSLVDMVPEILSKMNVKLGKKAEDKKSAPESSKEASAEATDKDAD